MIKTIIFVITLIGCITALVIAYEPYSESNQARKHALWAEEKTKEFAPKLLNRIAEIEEAILLTSDIQFEFDLTRYDAEDSQKVLFVWEDAIYQEHGGRPPRPLFAYEEDYQDMIGHFRQYQDLKRVIRELKAGNTDSLADQGKEALAFIDGLASRYIVIGRATAFRYPDPKGRDGANALFEGKVFIIDTMANAKGEDEPTGRRLEDPIFSEDGALEVIAFGKTRIAPPKPMITNPKFAKRRGEPEEEHEKRLNQAFVDQVKVAIRDEIETLTNKTISFDVAM